MLLQYTPYLTAMAVLVACSAFFSCSELFCIARVIFTVGKNSRGKGKVLTISRPNQGTTYTGAQVRELFGFATVEREEPDLTLSTLSIRNKGQLRAVR